MWNIIVMEVSSHALALGRVSGVEFGYGRIYEFDAKMRLDFHKTFENYLAR